MSTMSSKRSMPPRMMRVAPTVTDPSMHNGRSQSEMLLNEIGESPDDEQYHNKNKPKEDNTTDNTMLIIIFALVVVALVVIIVWMLMKNDNSKKDEDEIRQRIMSQRPPPGQYPMQRGRPYPQYPQQRQQRPPPVSKKEAEPEESDSEEEVQKKPAKSLSEALNVKPNKKLVKKSDKKAKRYNKDNPHPSILRPGGHSEEDATPSKSDVDDILARTKAALNESDSNEHDDDALVKAHKENNEVSSDEE
jgi:hypothetical protein